MHSLFEALFEGIAQAVVELTAAIFKDRSAERTRRIAAWGCLLVFAMMLGGIALLGMTITAR